MVDDYKDVVRAIARLTGFSTRKIVIDDREYDDDGYCIECWFTVNGRHYLTDFDDFYFD
ncbi:MAG: hypothetical protein Q4B30_08185 [Coriobacteriaceae bacterium]|nr:hypothetical protein [Coriobacteriaceae bacterium]